MQCVNQMGARVQWREPVASAICIGRRHIDDAMSSTCGHGACGLARHDALTKPVQVYMVSRGLQAAL